MKKLYFIVIVMLLSAQKVQAQKFQITKELLQSEEYSEENQPSAAYLRNNVEMKYNFDVPGEIRLEAEHHQVIKVYLEEGEQYGKFSIPCYNDQSSETVTDIRAVTYNLENGEIVKTKLSRKDIFEEKSSEKMTLVKFALPNVKKGSVLEIKYQFNTPFIRTIPKWYFQSYIPTKESILNISVPEYFTLTPVPTGSFPLDFQRQKIAGSKHGEMLYTMTARDVPAIKVDKYVLNENDYRSGIKYEIESVRFPNRFEEYYTKDWKQVAMDLLELDAYGKQLRKNFKDLEPIILEAKKKDEKSRIRFLYDHVRTTYDWNESYGVSSKDGLKKVIENKSGSVGDLNLLLIYLLQQSELNAHGVALTSRDQGLLNTHFPTLSRLNYLLATVFLDGDTTYMDASAHLCPLGQIPTRAVNNKGILLAPLADNVIDFNYQNEFKIITVSDYTVDIEKNKLIGTSTRRRQAYGATVYRMKYEEKKDEDNQEISEETAESDSDEEESDDQADDLESFDINNTYRISEHKGIDDVYEDIYLTYEEELNTNMKQVKDQLFIDATLDFGLKKNPFEEGVREYPIFYNYTVFSHTIANVEIPEGYQLDSKPQDINIAMPDKKGRFIYSVSVTGNKLMIHYKFTINKTTLLPSDYAALVALYDYASKVASEKIILSKM